jgi:hypothetical protein
MTVEDLDKLTETSLLLLQHSVAIFVILRFGYMALSVLYCGI